MNRLHSSWINSDNTNYFILIFSLEMLNSTPLHPTAHDQKVRFQKRLRWISYFLKCIWSWECGCTGMCFLFFSCSLEAHIHFSYFGPFSPHLFPSLPVSTKFSHLDHLCGQSKPKLSTHQNRTTFLTRRTPLIQTSNMAWLSFTFCVVHLMGLP